MRAKLILISYYNQELQKRMTNWDPNI